MVDKDTIIGKISALKKHLGRLKNLSKSPKPVFLTNQDLQQLAAFNLQTAIQNCIDIGSHIYAELDIGAPANYSEILYELSDREILTRAMCEKMIKMIGLRNRIAHDYEDIDQEKMYLILKNDLKDFESFIKQIIKYAKI